MMQQGQLAFAMAASLITVLVHIPDTLLLIQLHATVHGEAKEDGPGVWDPAFQEEDPAGVAGSWIRPDPELTILAT